jgi:hypothetical protein
MVGVALAIGCAFIGCQLHKWWNPHIKG